MIMKIQLGFLNLKITQSEFIQKDNISSVYQTFSQENRFPLCKTIRLHIEIIKTIPDLQNEAFFTIKTGTYNYSNCPNSLYLLQSGQQSCVRFCK